MPFPEQVGRAFTEAEISKLNAGQAGIYGIYRAGERWIYVGQAHDLRARLLEHVQGQSEESACIFKYQPTHWMAEVVSAALLDAREAILIRELNPACNQQL